MELHTSDVVPHREEGVKDSAVRTERDGSDENSDAEFPNSPIKASEGAWLYITKE